MRVMPGPKQLTSPQHASPNSEVDCCRSHRCQPLLFHSRSSKPALCVYPNFPSRRVPGYDLCSRAIIDVRQLASRSFHGSIQASTLIAISSINIQPIHRQGLRSRLRLRHRRPYSAVLDPASISAPSGTASTSWPSSRRPQGTHNPCTPRTRSPRAFCAS